jgi:hypothetical protein
LGAAARRDNPAAVTQVPLEFIDDTLGFNPEWIVDRIAPRPILFITTDDDRLVPPQESEAMYARAGEPKKLVVLKGFGHYEIYGGDAFCQVMEETLAWYGTHLRARRELPCVCRKRHSYECSTGHFATAVLPKIMPSDMQSR